MAPINPRSGHDTTTQTAMTIHAQWLLVPRTHSIPTLWVYLLYAYALNLGNVVLIKPSHLYLGLYNPTTSVNLRVGVVKLVSYRKWAHY